MKAIEFSKSIPKVNTPIKKTLKAVKEEEIDLITILEEQHKRYGK